MAELHALAERIGVPSELLTLGTCLVASFPLSAAFVRIPAAAQTLRHVFSIASTSCITLALFGPAALAHFLVPILATYVVTTYFGGNRWTPVLVFIGVMAHLLYVHFAVQVWYQNNPWAFADISAPMMVLTIRLTSYAWGVYDGTLKTEDIHEEMRPYAIRKVPNLIEYLGFIFFFASFWVGPSFEYRFYHDFVRQLPPYNNIPNPLRASMRNLGLGLALVVSFLLLDSKWNAKSCRDDHFYASNTFLQKIWYIQVVGFSTRAKLAAAWKISESACILTGIGYSGQDPKTHDPIFKRCENVNVKNVEFAPNIKMLIDDWNKKTADWLKRSVYLRYTRKGSKPDGMSTAITNLTSAIWHGVYPGYYLSFLSATFLIMSGRVARRYLRPLFITITSPFSPYKRIYDVLGWISAVGVLNYLFLAFLARRADASLRLWASVYWIGHVYTIGGILVLEMFGIGKVLLRWAGVPSPSKSGSSQEKVNGDVVVEDSSDANGGNLESSKKMD